LIVGNGLIAKSLKKFEKIDNIIVFASGVSNSNEKDIVEYNREKTLLSKYLDQNKRIIYFSSIGVKDPSVNHKPYFQFKIDQEKLIQSHCSENIIVRLPNMIGGVGNRNTFFNAVSQQLLQGKEVVVQQDAFRYFLHAVDLEKIIGYLIERNVSGIINCNYDNKLRVYDAVCIMANILKVKTNIKVVQGGNNYSVPVVQIMNEFASKNKNDIKFTFEQMSLFEYTRLGFFIA
jgi:nucleoside-diphosphate-sugar epimerase